MTTAQKNRLNEIIWDIEVLERQDKTDQLDAEKAIKTIKDILEKDNGVDAFHIIRVWKKESILKLIQLLSNIDNVINL